MVEISNAISKLKSGKVISLITFGHYPKLWSSRYITPIHKSNDISDLNNDRGISVTKLMQLRSSLIKYWIFGLTHF